ncbi:MAG: DUF4838 domain-containing protein [Ferruginibacter sp.]
MKSVFRSIFVLLCFGSFHSYAQQVIPIYYSPVEMPSFLKGNYFGQFDTKLLAEDLADLLKRSTGKRFSVIPYKKNVVKGIFLLLDTNAVNNGNETGKIETDGKSFIRISSKFTTGISYAMYSWLGEMGFRFYLPGDEWTIIPSAISFFTGKKFNRIYKPYFKLRMFNASGGIFPVKGLDDGSNNEKDWEKWYLRNRMGSDYLRIDGHIGELFNIVHKKQIEEDTLILAPVNDKRHYSEEGKLDPTNDRGVAMFSDWIVNEFGLHNKRMPTFLPFKKYYTVDAGDGLNYCHSIECQAMFKTVSDQVFSITNKTARKIKLADSRAGVSTLAYTERADTPTLKIEPNVHVMVVPTGFQSVSTSTELMQRWSKKFNNISQYDFLNIGVWYYDAPFFNMYQYHKDLQFLRSLKIEGMNFETSLSKFASGVQQYFILRYLNEPYVSIDKLLDEFCTNNFGKAGSAIKKLLKEWYFSDTHVNTNLDKASFYEDELGRFVNYIEEAENIGISGITVNSRITELKAYIIYLCQFYELFTDLPNQKAYAENESLRTKKIIELLTFTWQMYTTKIFHNTQLNDMLKKLIPEDQRNLWDFRKSDHFKNIKQKSIADIENDFKKVKGKYLPLARPSFIITDQFLANNVKYSADSIRIATIDELAFGNYMYPIDFYCGTPRPLMISYRTDSSKQKDNNQNKVAIVSVESADHTFLQLHEVNKENSSGKLIYFLPAKGHYKLYLSQYQATPVTYIIYPGKNLFYLAKRSIPMNGIMIQDNEKPNKYSNKYLAVPIPRADSLYFSNRYWNSTNTIKLYSEKGEQILVNSSREPMLNSADIHNSSKSSFIFFDNEVFRWPPIFKNTASYFFFLKYPLHINGKQTK